MKIGFYTDMHWSGVGPKRRKDDYLETVIRKHSWIYRDMEERGVDFIINGGDINETPLLANSVVNRQIEVMKENKILEFAIAGNHDVIGNNAERLNQVSMSILFSAGLLQDIDDPTLLRAGDVDVALYGVDIHKDMDNLRPEDYCVASHPHADFTVLVAHGWLTDRPIDIAGLRHTTFDEVIATGTEADLILTGHYHPGHGIVKKKRQDGGDVYFCNPGSPVRMKALASEMTRQVGYHLITLDDTGIDVEFVPIAIARPAEEVIDRESLIEDVRRKEERKNIQSKYTGITLRATSPRGAIIEAMEEAALPEAAKEDLFRRLEEVEEALEKDKESYEV